MNNNTDKRSVSTDALETLGMLIGPNEKRDAIHLAVIPCVAKECLQPGEHVTACGMGKYTPTVPTVGIVDPFLPRGVKEGERFWLVIYPRKITSLRHVWTHPEFPEEIGISLSEIEKSRAWMQDCLNIIDCHDSLNTVDDLLEAAKKYLKDGSQVTFYEDIDNNIPDDFWNHFEILTNQKVPDRERRSFFKCYC